MQGCFPVLLRGPGKIHNHSTFITVAIEWIIEASCAFPTCIQVGGKNMVWGLERLKLIINWEAVKLLKQSCKKSAFRPSPIVTELNQLICCYVTCRKSGDKSDKNNSCTKNSTTSPSSFVHVFGKLYILMLYCMLRYCPCDL
ncbi:uncharacterized protein [Spinacia oleracea]|uniref:Uncharacterized protein isoform X1 n=1 Tax=Spinacia oleracea TaxID=3562 RepID=A0ABM3RQZ9_SPIOL|nr:uncharacterized protein LOC110787320 isoform X1 [Spinacia oleracea]